MCLLDCCLYARPQPNVPVAELQARQHHVGVLPARLMLTTGRFESIAEGDDLGATPPTLQECHDSGEWRGCAPSNWHGRRMVAGPASSTTIAKQC